MSEQWLGLHNRGWHTPVEGEALQALCNCKSGNEPLVIACPCTELRLCWCCLTSEVETLRAQVQALRATVERWAESVEHTQCGRSGEPQCECCYDVMPVRAENDALRATIARVRETVARHQRIYAGSRDDGVPVQVILQALGGER